jgi:hypothetical protein
MDLVVEDAVVLELKTVDQLLPIHSAQLLTYLKLSGKKLGLLINFNEPVLAKGLKRLVNHFRDAAPAPGREPIPSAPSAPSGFGFDSLANSLNSLRLCVSAVKTTFATPPLRRGKEPIPSAPSALSGFDLNSLANSLNSLRLCVSAVKT